MKKIILFAGTYEGRLLAEYLAAQPVLLHICTATDYGASLMPGGKNLSVMPGRLDQTQMADILKRESYDLAIDATHPYADRASANIKLACTENALEYLRVIRGEGDLWDEAVFVPNSAAAGLAIAKTEGPVLLTTGSKDLDIYMSVPGAEKRIYARILPGQENLTKAIGSGLSPSHLFCMQGPFSREMNVALIDHVRTDYGKSHSPEAPLTLVTKDGGTPGGFPAKVEAARDTSSRLIVIGRPDIQEGLGLDDAIVWLEKWGDFPVEPIPSKRQIFLIGAGLCPDHLTGEARDALNSADMVIGARRVIDMLGIRDRKVMISCDYKAVTEYLLKHPDIGRAALIFSGDIGFYSGAAGMRRAVDSWAPGAFEIKNFSGISSALYFLNRLGKTWQDVRFLSLHGRDMALASPLAAYGRILVMLGKSSDVADACGRLMEYGFPDAEIWVGSELAGKNEMIEKGRPEDFIGRSFSPISLIYVESGRERTGPTSGLADHLFTRGSVPMTKSEPRIQVLSALALKPDSLLWDIGAGTGSVSVEAARLIPEGKVYAVEKNAEAAELVRENSRKFHTDNISVVIGEAPRCLEGDILPTPSHVFIGGSGGELERTVNIIRERAPRARIVATAVTLESISELSRIAGQMEVEGYAVSVVQVSAARADRAGRYNIMKARDPVYIFTFRHEDS